MKKMLQQGENVLITRLQNDKAKEISESFPDSTYHERAKILTLIQSPIEIRGKIASDTELQVPI